MRNKRVRELREKALYIIPPEKIQTGSGAYGMGNYSRASNPYKNFIRNYRKGKIV